MTEELDIREQVRVYVSDLVDAPASADLEVADEDDPGEYYYEVPLSELGKKVGKRYVRYEGPEGRGFFDTARGVLKVRPAREDEETNADAVKNEVVSKADQILEKYKIYVSDADTLSEARQMAPEWADVQETEQGAFYYEKLPGQGDGDEEQEYETGQYDVDTTFGSIVADRVLNDDVGDIPVDDFYEHMSEVEDPDLVKDALQAEMEGPNRKTGKQFIESRARDLGIDLDLFYKERGPDETTDGTLTSLTDLDVTVEDLPDEPVILADESDHCNRDWTYREVWNEYVEGDRQMPRGIGNPDDVPAGVLKRSLEDLDNPGVLMAFYEKGNYQIRRDVSEILEEEHGVIPKVETVPGKYRFDLDGMQEFMTDEEAQNLEPGDVVAIDDFAGGFQEAEVVEVRNAGIEVISPDGRGASQEIPLTNIYTPEYYLASALEKDGLHQSSMLDWTAPDGLIDKIEDSSVLSRALEWDTDETAMALRPETKEAINSRLFDLEPPDPSEYGMSEEAMNLLHGATWPEWDSRGARKQGTGLSDDLKSVYEGATTEDLEKYRTVCQDNDLDDRANVVTGMLFYRDDSDVDIQDVFEYERTAHGNYSGVTDNAKDRIMGAAEDTMHNMEPHIGGQLGGHIEKFELQMPPDGSNWVGQSQGGGRVMAIDDPYNVEKTTSHEMGHAFHNFLGVENDGYGTIDNRDHSNDPSRWKFGAKAPGNDNRAANEFYDDMKGEWEKYKDTMAGKRSDANEIRSYQKRHGVELMAVGFAHWNMDPFKLRNRHPGLAKAFDKHLGDGIVDPLDPEEVETGEYYEVAKEGMSRMTVEVTDVVQNSRGGYSYDVQVVEGDLSGTRTTLNSDNTFFEGKAEDYQPLEYGHGTKYTVETQSGEKTAYIDRETRALGGDFFVRDEMGRPIGQWTKDQLERNLVSRDFEEGEVPWSPDRAEKGDLVEMYGVEVNVRDADDFNNELVLEDSNGETQTLSFDEVNELREQGDFEPVTNVVDWGDMSSNNSYQFVTEDGRYNGEVVGIDEDTVTITQPGVGESTVDRAGVEEIRRRA
ncbi:hypothetical protein DNAM5_106 [Haloarcula californiae tailed virus 1]|uniref:Uncharacterized protein n=1 Tax=Haloarcula californiae tailed virus 1 TaxID=1273746 RepID=R4TAK5_9CAUD|nr:hypothetical protein M202_gp113 [Haloarcula californiae tailed virus 1]AGM11965.1 hypothetical protein DNAM5_106 [Haloarcula californiae tailed virus 1]